MKLKEYLETRKISKNIFKVIAINSICDYPLIHYHMHTLLQL